MACYIKIFVYRLARAARFCLFISWDEPFHTCECRVAKIERIVKFIVLHLFVENILSLRVSLCPQYLLFGGFTENIKTE